MGLDMYLSVSRCVSDVFDEEREIHDSLMKAMAENMMSSPLPRHTMFNSMVINIGVASWRKANQIHRWFVENVQDGVDDCGEYDVAPCQLGELREKCEYLLSRKQAMEDGEISQTELEYECQQTLPIQSGFFFGGTDIDEWYWDDLEYTVNALEDVLKWCRDEREAGKFWSLRYHSSW